MTINADSLGIWLTLGSITPNLKEFLPFGQIDHISTLFRIRTIGEVGNVKTWLRQSFDNFVDNKWIRLFPENGTNKIITIPLPKEFNNNQVARFIEIKNTPLYRRLGNDADPSFTLTIYQFIPFQITDTGDNTGNIDNNQNNDFGNNTTKIIL